MVVRYLTNEFDCMTGRHMYGYGGNARDFIRGNEAFCRR